MVEGGKQVITLWILGAELWKMRKESESSVEEKRNREEEKKREEEVERRLVP